MKKSKFIISMFITFLFLSITLTHYNPANAQCGAVQLSRIFWDGYNHAVEGCIAFPADYGFTFSGPVNFTAYQNFTGSGNFTLPFGGLPEPLPAHTTISVYVSSPHVSNTVSCTTNSQGYCAPEPPPPPDTDGDGVLDPYDACPTQGSVGYGIYPNGCPILDSDGDGVSDPNDSCPSQGSIGYGIYPNGCPVLDSDSDGVPDPNDACPGQGSIGYGVTANGCPIQPPPPPSDRDRDGIPDDTDRCPEQGSMGYGVYMSGPQTGCPIPPPVTPTPSANDRDGDGILDNQDQCPDEKGPRSTNGCQRPAICHVGFLVDVVYLRSGPGTVYNSVSNKSFRDTPIRAIGRVANPNNQAELWFELEGGLYVIDNPNWVRLGSPCDFSQINISNVPIEIPDSDTDGIPDMIDACVDRGNEGYGVKNDGCPKTVQDILTNVRESHPRDVMRLLGCEIVTGELLDTAPLFVLMTIVESPSPCDAKTEYNRQQQTTPSLEIARTYFNATTERQQFFERLLTCDSLVSNNIIDLLAEGAEALIDTFIAETIHDGNICDKLLAWRNTPDIIPIPPDLSPRDSINWGILICIPYNLLNTRYQQLVSNLLDIWELNITEITCDDVNSANHIGNPNQDHLNLFRKLIECRNENIVILKPIWTLEKLIINNDDIASLLNLSCEELIANTYCASTDCISNIILPPALQICALSEDDRALMTLFIKNYVPKAGEEGVNGKLSQAQLDLIYADINSCDAVIEFLNTGVIRQPIKLPPPIESLPPSDDDNNQNTPEVTPVPTLAPTSPPVTLTPTTTIVVKALTPPTPETGKERELWLSTLGIDKAKPTNILTDMIGIVYANNRNIYIRKNGVETKFEDGEIGEKYSPILFTLNNYQILAYILVQDGITRIRVHNFKTGNAEFAILPNDVQIDHQSRLAYSNSLLVFTGIDHKNQYNLYGISFSGTAKVDTSYLLITNAKNASAVEGLGGFVFEQPNGTNNIQLWIPGRNILTPIDEQIEGSCNDPVGEIYKGKWRFWFLCDYYDEPTLFVQAMESNIADVVDINHDLKKEGANINTISLSLGELQGELFISDGQGIFLYHQRKGVYSVVRLPFSTTSHVYTFSRE